MSDILVVFFLLLYAVVLVLTRPLELILNPPVCTTYLGGDVHFICTKDPSISKIAWSTPIFPTVFHNNHLNFSEFRFTVSDISWNNTLLHCIGRNPSNPSMIYTSNAGLILIQGINFIGGVLP